MRPDFTTEAVVVKVRDYKEADRLYTLFTAERGMITAHGTSTRKPLSKLAGHFAVPGIVRVFLVKGRQFERIAGVQLIEHFARFSASLRGMQTYGALQQMLGIAHPEPEQDLPIFDAFVALCRRLQQPGAWDRRERRDLLVYLFGIRLLAHSGYHPHVTTCVRCGDASKPFIGFSVSAGGLVCAACPSQVRDYFPVPTSVIGLIQRILHRDKAQTSPRFSVPPTDVSFFCNLVQRMLQYHFAPTHALVDVQMQPLKV